MNLLPLLSMDLQNGRVWSATSKFFWTHCALEDFIVSLHLKQLLTISAIHKSYVYVDINNVFKK